jgi:hypothetical protein
VSWSLPFSEPIVLADGSELPTLQDACDYLNNLPKSEQNGEEWQAAAYRLVEAAEHGGALAFARIAMLRAMKQQANHAPTRELVNLTLREVQRLKIDYVDSALRDHAPLSLPGVMETIIAIVTSPAIPVKTSEPTSKGRESELVVPIKSTDTQCLIGTETLQSAITQAVKEAGPACETFVGVIVQRITPKSRFDTNWAVKGVKFGKADREKANQAVATVVERMQREFRLSDD